MAGPQKSDFEYRAEVRREAERAGDPLNDDTVIEVSHDMVGNPRVNSVKPVWRPPENLSEPIRPYWKWIWITVIVLVVLAWIFLFWYFSNHHAPYSAPLK